MFDKYGKSLAEKNKCPIVHLFEAFPTIENNQLTNQCIACLDQLHVSNFASQLRRDQYQQAMERENALVEQTVNEALTVAEHRSRTNDALLPNRDRDYKSSICFPPRRMGRFNITMASAPPIV